MDWRSPSPGEEVPPHLLKEWREEERAIRIFEDPGCFGLSLASAEELTDGTPEKWERVVDRMEAEDTSSYDVDGRVW